MSGLSADSSSASTLDMAAVLSLVTDSAVEVLKAEAGLLLLLEGGEGGGAALVLRAASGPVVPSLVGQRLAAEEGIVGDVLRSGQGCYSNDPRSDAAWSPVLDMLAGYETRAILCVPLSSRERPLGALQVLNRRDGTPFGDDDVELLAALAAQAALALENARQYQEVKRLYEQTDRELNKRLRELSIIEEIDRELGSSLDYDRSINFVLERAVEACGANSGGIGILLPGGQRLDVRLWLGGELAPLIADQWPVERGIIGRVAQSGEPLLIDDALAEPGWETIADATRSVLAVPIRREEQVTGVLSLESERLAAFGPDDARFLAHLADHAGIAIENARLFEQTDERLQARIDELTFLQRTTQEINATLALDRILTTVLELALQNTGATHGDAMLIDLTTGDLTLRATVGYTPEEEASAARSLQQSAADSLALQVAESGEARLVEDARRESCTVCARLDTRSALIVPIVTEGLVIGLVNLYHTRVAAFNRSNLDFVQSLAQQAALAIGNAMRFEDQVRSNDALRRRNEQMRSLLAVGQKMRADLPLESALEEVAYAIQETVGFNVVLISVVEDAAPMLRRVAAAGLPLSLFEEARQVRQPLTIYERLYDERYRQGQCYFFPFQERERWGAELHTLDPMPETEDWQEGQWHSRDMLVVPLRGTGGRLLGHISVDEPRDGRRPSRPTLEALAVFANQAAVAVENARLFDAARRRVAELATVNQIGRAISSALDVEQLSELIYSQVSILLDSRNFFIGLYDRETGRISIEFNMEEGQRQPPVYLQLGQGLTSYLLTTGRGLLLTHGVEDFIREHNLTLEGRLARSWLGVPMIAEDRAIGVIAVQSYEREYAFDEEHLELLMTIAGQAAVAFQNASLFEERERRISELAILNKVAQAVSSTLELDALLELVYKQVAQLVDATNFYIALYNEDRDEIAFPFVVDPEQRGDWSPCRGGMGLAGRVIETGEPLLLPQGRAGLGQEADQEIDAGLCCSWLGVPMIAGDKVLGVIAVQDYECEYVYDETDVRLLSTVAAQVAMAVRNAQLYQQIVGFSAELEERVAARTRELAEAANELALERDRAATLYRITSELSTTFDLDRVLVRALQLFADTLGVQHGTVMLLDQETGLLTLKATLDPDRKLPRGGRVTPFKRGVGLAGWVLESRETVLVPDILEDERWLQIPGREVEARSVVIAPLSLGGGDILGVLTLGHRAVGYFSQDHLQLVTAAASQLAVAVSNADLYAFITDQADQLGVTLQAMQAEADKGRAILESIGDGVLVLDHKGQVLLVNPAAEELLGITAMALEGEHFRHMLGLGETAEHRDLAQGLYTELRTRQDAIIRGETELQTTAVRLESGTRALAVNIAPLITTIGQAPGLVAALRDVSREAEVERLKNEFISTVSHELRTPMTSIKGYTDLLFLGMAGGLTDAQRNFLQIIKSNADRLTALVNDILDISRIETGRLRLSIEALDLRQIISQAVTAFQEQYRDKGLELIWEEPEELSEARGDAARVTQVLSNLIANAWQYTPSGGKVTISAYERDGYLQVDVADDGIGIAPDDLPRVFDRFYRVDRPAVQEVEGTGLGLSIVKMFVEMLGGEIWVESKLDAGSTFSFTLPLSAAESIEEEVIQSDLLTTELPAVARRRPKILLVETDRELALGLRQHLEVEGYQVLLAGSGEDALWLAQEEQPQLITLDIMLPDMDGFTVLEQLKEHPGTAPIPVVVFSVFGEMDKGYALGAVDYVIKPFEEDKLLETVQLALSSIESDGPHDVLVVDDDPDILALLDHALSYHGYHVRRAVDGWAALDQVAERLPDLILLDFKMPRMDGYEVIRRLKADPNTRPVPIVVITASPVDKERDRVRVLGTGVAQYVAKPLSIETLVAELKSVISERSQE